MTTNICRIIPEWNLDKTKKLEHKDWVLISIDDAKDNINWKLNNKFEWINFNSNLDIGTFSINLDDFYIRLEQAKIKDKDELDIIIKLLEEINNYITLNKDLLLNWSKWTLVWIKITYNDLNTKFLKRLEMLWFLDNNQINETYKKVKNDYKNTYYLFIPPNAKELPNNISPIKYIRKLKIDKTIYSNQEKFDELYNWLSDICNKLIFQSSDFINMDNYQINELIYCLEEIEKQVTNKLSEDESNNSLNGKIKNKMNQLYRYYLSWAIRNIKKIQILKEMPEKINTFFDKINLYWCKETVENTYKDYEAFWGLLETYREFSRYIILIEKSINQIKKEDLEKLLKTISNFRILLIRLKNIKERDTPIYKKIVYNSKQAYDSLIRISDNFNLALTSQ